MDSARIKNLYISNLDTIRYQSSEIIYNSDSNIFYEDFYTFYNQYVKHLQEVKWNNMLIEQNVKKFPVMEKPRLLFTCFLFLFIPWLAVVFPTFDITTFLIYSIPLVCVILVINFFLQRRKKRKLEEVIKLCSLLKEELELMD